MRRARWSKCFRVGGRQPLVEFYKTLTYQDKILVHAALRRIEQYGLDVRPKDESGVCMFYLPGDPHPFRAYCAVEPPESGRLVFLLGEPVRAGEEPEMSFRRAKERLQEWRTSQSQR
jgi:hypothetical protein